MGTLYRLRDFRPKKTVFFSRPELNRLLSLYSRKVAAGEWRDYAIDHQDGMALFSVFRHTQETALFTIMKCAPGSNRHGDFLVFNGRRRLEAGRSLGDVLAVLEKKLSLVSSAP
jgi:Protein of unknown function (DUF2794)